MFNSLSIWWVMTQLKDWCSRYLWSSSKSLSFYNCANFVSLFSLIFGSTLSIKYILLVILYLGLIVCKRLVNLTLVTTDKGYYLAPSSQLSYDQYTQPSDHLYPYFYSHLCFFHGGLLSVLLFFQLSYFFFL